MSVRAGFRYPTSGELVISRAEFQLLQELYRRIVQERLASDTLGAAEAVAAIRATDMVVAKISGLYRATV